MDADVDLVSAGIVVSSFWWEEAEVDLGGEGWSFTASMSSGSDEVSGVDILSA